MNISRALAICLLLLMASGASADMVEGGSAYWFAKGGDVLIGTTGYDAATGLEKQVVLAIGYKKSWISCETVVSLMAFSGRSIGSATAQHVSKKYSDQLELVVNGKAFSGTTKINTYPNNGIELAMIAPDGLIRGLSAAREVVVRFGGRADAIVRWKYGNEFAVENSKAMKVCS